MKRLKSEVYGLRRQLSKDATGRDRTTRLDRNLSLPRSPQRQNINVSIQSNGDPDQKAAPGRYELTGSFIRLLPEICGFLYIRQT